MVSHVVVAREVKVFFLCFEFKLFLFPMLNPTIFYYSLEPHAYEYTSSAVIWFEFRLFFLPMLNPTIFYYSFEPHAYEYTSFAVI